MDYLLPSFKRELTYRGLVESSIVNYDRTFAMYRAFCDYKGYKFELTVNRYKAWSEWLLSCRAPRTCNLYLMLMRSFAKWAFDEGDLDFELPYISFDPGVSKPQTLPDDALVKILNVIKESPRNVARRDELIVRLLIDTGVRRAELVGIKLNHIDIQDMSIKVMGKGSKPRTVYFGNNTGRALDRYLRVRADFPHADTDFLLLGLQGPMKVGGIRRLMERLKAKTGLPHLRPHMFRHTFCHDWLDSGGNPRDLMRVAGWNSERMLDVYGAEQAQQRAANSHKRLSRGDRV